MGKMKNGILKRIFAIVMMLCVVMSYSGFAFAEGTGGNQNTAPTVKSQIGDYYQANDNNSGALAQNPTIKAGSTLKKYETTIDSSGQVRINKTIAATGNENEFEVTLDVTTKDVIEETVETDSNAAVVLVVDISGSMKNNNIAPNKTRLKAAQESANAFIDAFKTTEDGVRREVAVVSFSGFASSNTDGATVRQGWTSASDDSLKTTINGLTADGGTNMYAGLMLAKKLLDQTDIKNKSVILLTDGEPTLGVENPSSQTSNDVVCAGGTGMTGDGYVGQYKNGVLQPITRIHDIHTQMESFDFGDDVDKYSVFIGSVKFRCDHNGCSIKNTYGTTGIDCSVWLQNNCGFTTYSAADADKLELTFRNIANLMAIKLDAWKVTDPMGSYLDYTGSAAGNSSSANASVSYSSTNKEFVWNLRTTSPIGTNPYHYQYKYKVKLNNYKTGWTKDTLYPANGATELKYFLEEDSQSENPALKYGYFNVPSVKGFVGTLEFKKVDEEGDALAGAQFTLTSDDNKDYSLTATSASNGTVKFENIPSGHTYTLTETKAASNYAKDSNSYKVYVNYGVVTSTIPENEDEELEIVNYPATTDITVEKVWDDNNNQDGKRASSVTVTLKADGKEVSEETTNVTIDATSSWKYTFTNLPKAANGKAISYTVDEAAVTGYTPSSSIDSNYKITLKNIHTPEKTSVTVTKTWAGEPVIDEPEIPDPEDGDATDGEEAGTPEETGTIQPLADDEEETTTSPRPDSITVNLLANGTKVDSKTIDASDNWTWKFENLDKYSGGQEITYTVTEDTVTDYVTSISGYNITNTYSPNKTSVTVNKTWNDGNDQDGKRPESVVIALYADGENTGKTVTLSEENSWQAVFEDLKARTKESDASSVIHYTVQEVTKGMPEGYTAEVTGSQTSGYTVTNSYTPETATLGVKKLWDDNDNAAKARPESVKIYLIADGEVTDTYVTLTADNNWQATFTGIAKKSEGKDIEYSVKESEVKEYTTESVVKNNDGIWEVTNKYTPTYYPPVTPSVDPNGDSGNPPAEPDDTPDNPDNPDNPSVDPNGGSSTIDDDSNIDTDPMGDPDAIGSDDDITADPMGVKTGDSTDMIPWALGFGTAIMLLAGAVALRRREDEK